MLCGLFAYSRASCLKRPDASCSRPFVERPPAQTDSLHARMLAESRRSQRREALESFPSCWARRLWELAVLNADSTVTSDHDHPSARNAAEYRVPVGLRRFSNRRASTESAVGSGIVHLLARCELRRAAISYKTGKGRTYIATSRGNRLPHGFVSRAEGATRRTRQPSPGLPRLRHRAFWMAGISRPGRTL